MCLGYNKYYFYYITLVVRYLEGRKATVDVRQLPTGPRTVKKYDLLCTTPSSFIIFLASITYLQCSLCAM